MTGTFPFADGIGRYFASKSSSQQRAGGSLDFGAADQEININILPERRVGEGPDGKRRAFHDRGGDLCPAQNLQHAKHFRNQGHRREKSAAAQAAKNLLQGTARRLVLNRQEFLGKQARYSVRFGDCDEPLRRESCKRGSCVQAGPGRT